eukprot:1019173-Pelagomonas_calceolata.AAC.1
MPVVQAPRPRDGHSGDTPSAKSVRAGNAHFGVRPNNNAQQQQESPQTVLDRLGSHDTAGEPESVKTEVLCANVRSHHISVLVETGCAGRRGHGVAIIASNGSPAWCCIHQPPRKVTPALLLCGDFNAKIGSLREVSDAYYEALVDCPDLQIAR